MITLKNMVLTSVGRQEHGTDMLPVANAFKYHETGSRRKRFLKMLVTLNKGLIDHTELTKKRKKAVTGVAAASILSSLVSDVFLPQQPGPGMWKHRVFNISVASSSWFVPLIRCDGGQITSALQLIKVIPNIANIFC